MDEISHGKNEKRVGLRVELWGDRRWGVVEPTEKTEEEQLERRDREGTIPVVEGWEDLKREGVVNNGEK